jgi:hypothetical protein
MDMRGCLAIVVVSLSLATHAALAQTTNGASTLRAGAAKIDITPSAGELPKNNLGVLDRLYARAIVLDNGSDERGADHRGCRRDPGCAVADGVRTD